jgi:hypothetical protein
MAAVLTFRSSVKGLCVDVQVVHLDCETARDEPTLLDKERWNMRQFSIQTFTPGYI